MSAPTLKNEMNKIKTAVHEQNNTVYIKKKIKHFANPLILNLTYQK
jgi:hypothetical protein